MATFERRGQYWRVKVRRTGLPPQTRTFDNKTQAQLWARCVESDIDKGIVVDRRVAERLSLAEVLERYRREVTPTKRGAADENIRLKAMAERPFARIRMAAAHKLPPGGVSRCAAEGRLRRNGKPRIQRALARDRDGPAGVGRLPARQSLHARAPPSRRDDPRNRRLQDDEEQRLLAACRKAPATNGSRISLPLPSKQACGAASSSGLQWDERGPRSAHCLPAGHQEWRIPRRTPLEPCGRHPSWTPARPATAAFLATSPKYALKQSFKRAVRRAGIKGSALARSQA